MLDGCWRDVYKRQLHDIGKYSVDFLKRITGESNQRVDHSTAGARVCIEKGGKYSFLEYCIAGHHAGLPDYGSNYDNAGDPTLMGRDVYKRQILYIQI